jgi:hypothetical protein
MSNWQWGTRRSVILGVIIVAAVGVPAFILWPRDSSRPISSDEAVQNFRASTVPTDPPTATRPVTNPTDPPSPTVNEPAATTSPAPTTSPTTRSTTTTPASSTTTPSGTTLPAPGVYRYATTGWERIDALDGTQHDYPAETTITVTPDGCGVRLRWDPLAERREEWNLCVTDAGIELQADSIQYHEFFGRGELEDLECDQGVVVVPTGDPPSGPVVQTCMLEADPWVGTWTAPERSTREVDGDEIAVWHVAMTVDDNDEYWEHTTIEWYLDPHGLPVAAASTKESISPSIVGDVIYEETFEMNLVSTTPLR